MIVLDASAALKLPLRAGDRRVLVDRVLRSGEAIAAPQLLDLEVLQVPRRFVMVEALDAVLVACDGRLTAVPGAHLAVEVIPS